MQVNVFKVKFDEDCLSLKRSVVFIFFLYFLRTSTVYGQVENGKADLSHIDFSNDILELNGNWNFYWSALLSPSHQSCDTDSTILVPGSWSKQNKYSVTGYGTYQLNLKLSSGQPPVAICFPIINSAYTVWINGKLYTAVGQVATVSSQYEASLENTIVQLPDTTHINILIHVANFSYFSAGIARAPLIGNSKNLYRRLNQEKAILNFFAGCFIAIFVYQFALFLLYPRGKPYLWLSLICLIIALRSLIVHGGSFMLPELFPGVPTELWKKIEFGGVYGLGSLVALYVYHLYENVAKKLPLFFLIFCSFILLVFVAVTPQYQYGKLLDVAHLILILAIVYSFYTIMKAKMAGYNEAMIIFYGLFFSTPFFLIGIYLNNTIARVSLDSSLNLFFPVEIGLLIFLGFQVYLLAQHYAKSYEALSNINVALEQQVTERSKKLLETSLIKDKLLSIISHDVKAPINSLRGALMLFNKGVLETIEFKNLTNNIEEELNKTAILIEDILHWSKIQLNGDLMDKELFDLRELIETNIQLYKSTAKRKAIEFEYSINTLLVCWDKHILNMVLRNLFANAIKFSHYNSQIKVFVKNDGNQVTIGVRDYGVGMETEFLDTINQSIGTKSQPGTEGEKGNGIGLALAREYFTKAGGRLLCSSKPNEGTEFLICFSSVNVKT